MKLLALGTLVVLTLLRFWLAGTQPLTADESYFWMCTQNPAWAYFDGPGGTAAVARGTASLLGDSPFGLRVAFPLFALAASAGIFLLGSTLWSARVGYAAVLLLNVLPFFNLAATHVSPALPTLAMVLFAAWAGWKAVERDRNLGAWCLFGLLVGIGAHFSYSVLLIWFAIFAMCLAAARYRGRFNSVSLYVGGAITGACILPLLSWNRKNDWPLFSGGTLQTAFSVKGEGVLDALVNLNGTLSVFAAILVVAAFVVVVSRCRQQLRPRYILLLSLPFAAIWLYNELHGVSDHASLIVAGGLLLPYAAERASGWPLGSNLIPATAALTALITVAAMLVPALRANPWVQGDNLIPWEQVAAEAEVVRQQIQPDQPEDVFFIAMNPAFTAALSYHLPRVARGENREVFLRESQNLSNQYGLWPRYDRFKEIDAPPDEYFKELKAFNPYVGRSAIYVTDEADLPQTITGAFRDVSAASEKQINDTHGNPRTLRFYFCHDYQTMPL